MHLSSTTSKSKTKTKNQHTTSSLLLSTNKKYNSKSNINIIKSSNIKQMTTKRSISHVSSSQTSNKNSPKSFTTTTSTSSSPISPEEQLQELKEQLQNLQTNLQNYLNSNQPSIEQSITSIPTLTNQTNQVQIQVRQQTSSLNKQLTALTKKQSQLRNQLHIQDQFIAAMIKTSVRCDYKNHIPPIHIKFAEKHQIEQIEVDCDLSQELDDFIHELFNNEDFPQLQPYKYILNHPKLNMYLQCYHYDCKNQSLKLKIYGKNSYGPSNMFCLGTDGDLGRSIELSWDLDGDDHSTSTDSDEIDSDIGFETSYDIDSDIGSETMDLLSDDDNDDDITTTSNNYITPNSQNSTTSPTTISQSTLLTNFMLCSNYQYQLKNTTIQFWDETFPSLHIPLLKTNHSFRRFCIEHLGFNDRYYIKNGGQIDMVRAETSPFSTQFASQNLYISTPSLLNGEWFSIKQLEIDVNDLFIGHIITEHNATIKLKWLPDQINDNNHNQPQQPQQPQPHQHEQQDQDQNKQQLEQQGENQDDTKIELQQATILNENQQHDISIEHSNPQQSQQEPSISSTPTSIEHSEQTKLSIQQQTELSKIYFQNASTLFQSGDKSKVMIQIESPPSIHSIIQDINKSSNLLSTTVESINTASIADVLEHVGIVIPSQYFIISVSSPAVLNGQWVTINNDELTLQHTLLCGFLSPTLTKESTTNSSSEISSTNSSTSSIDSDVNNISDTGTSEQQIESIHHIKMKWDFNPQYNLTTEMKQQLLHISPILTNRRHHMIQKCGSQFSYRIPPFKSTDKSSGFIHFYWMITSSRGTMYPRYQSIADIFKKDRGNYRVYETGDSVSFSFDDQKNYHEFIGDNAIPNILENIPIIYGYYIPPDWKTQNRYEHPPETNIYFKIKKPEDHLQGHQ